MFRNSILVVFLLLVAALAQDNKSGGKQSKPEAAGDKAGQPAVQEVKVSRPKSFDLDAIDKSVNPCDDFYEYACGTWRRKNPIPADQSRWSRFNELQEYNRQVLHEILENAAANGARRTSVMQKIGDFYQSCMDETTVNQKGLSPLKPQLERIAAVENKDKLIATLAYLQSQGVNALFAFGSQPDLHDATMVIAGVVQGGLGLPDRDYYICLLYTSPSPRDS